MTRIENLAYKSKAPMVDLTGLDVNDSEGDRENFVKVSFSALSQNDVDTNGKKLPVHPITTPKNSQLISPLSRSSTEKDLRRFR